MRKASFLKFYFQKLVNTATLPVACNLIALYNRRCRCCSFYVSCARCPKKGEWRNLLVRPCIPLWVQRILFRIESETQHVREFVDVFVIQSFSQRLRLQKRHVNNKVHDMCHVFLIFSQTYFKNLLQNYGVLYTYTMYSLIMQLTFVFGKMSYIWTSFMRMIVYLFLLLCFSANAWSLPWKRDRFAATSPPTGFSSMCGESSHHSPLSTWYLRSLLAIPFCSWCRYKKIILVFVRFFSCNMSTTRITSCRAQIRRRTFAASNLISFAFERCFP